jgi:ABC-2 type transport system permease protein
MNEIRALSWIEVKLFLREPITVVFTLALPPLVLYVLAEVFGNTPDPEGTVFRGVGAINYYVPAYIGLVAASLGVIGLPVHLASYRERGVLRRFQAARVPVGALLVSQLAVLVAGMLAGSALLLALARMLYDIVWPANWLGVTAAAGLGIVVFAALGALLGVAMPTARAAQGIGILLWFLMQMLCGAGPPTEVLSPSLNRVGTALPLRHLIVALQDPWLGKGFNWTEMAILATIAVVAGGLAATLLRRRS